jgi:hypothetical protein
MNQKLQNMFDLVQQSQNLNAEEKQSILKALEDADKEFEIILFKLDRTEKVKKTTEILLEETIEELEQKRKAIEFQNRKLEIETALERVRAIALSMHKPDDMVEVCRVISVQLELLNVSDIRNIQTAIITDQKGTYLNYEYFTQYKSTSILEIVTKLHPVVEEFANEISKSKEAFFTKSFEGEALKDWIEYRKNTNQNPDPKLEEVNSLHYYFYSIGPGALGISTYSPLSDEEIKIFKMFRNVFELAYRRFIDIELAMAQAREAQIGASLEKVRSATMSMHKSDELTETAAVVFKQLMNLGIEPNRIYIAILKNEKGSVEFWITDEDGRKVSSAFTANLNDNPSFRKMFIGWKEKQKSVTIDMHGKELKEYFRHLTKLGVPFKGGLSQKRRMQYIAYFSQGFIGVASPDETRPETLKLLERFAAVFNLTFTRFNDLIQAEAQNKIIQAENERKTKELEEARRMQLAMLPKEVPQLPHLDIAVYMKTATEVGGDYYDFSIKEDGALNICLGDATGHGMKAGIMVSSMKSIFTTNATKMDIENFFATANSGIKSMNLKRMMMGFTMLTINSHCFRLINAGMPPVYLYRKKQHTVQELKEHGLPVGAMNLSKYNVTEESMDKGDVLLLLTDGMPELKNEKKDLFGYKRLQECFIRTAKMDPQKIIEHLKNSASQWVDEQDPEDDVTFVVIKVK